VVIVSLNFVIHYIPMLIHTSN